MDSKMNALDRELYRAVDEVLHYIWDPIGVSDEPRARDEYHSYLPHVVTMLVSGANEQAIASYLNDVTTSQMGLPSNAQHDRDVTKILLDWKEAIDEKKVPQ